MKTLLAGRGAWRPIPLAFASFSLLALSACDQNFQVVTPGVPKVVVSNPVKDRITDWDNFTGRFEATDSVEIRSRVSGYLQKVAFQDGAIVKKGDLLFEIDPRPFQAALIQAQGKMNETRAQLSFAEQEFTRASVLIESKTIAKSLFEQRLQAKQAAQANVLIAQGALDQAKLDLDFTRITAPMPGRISKKMISEGNLVNGGDSNATVLTTIVSLDPIDIYFDIDEQSYLKYQRQGKPGARAQEVRIALPGEAEPRITGRVDFIDNRLDSSTGTLRQRARVSNPALQLTPGQFGRVQFSGRPSYEALLLPDTAISTDATRKIVYVLTADNKVEVRAIQPGKMQGNLREIVSGLQASDRVIVDGIQRVHQGDSALPEGQAIVNREHSNEVRDSEAQL